MVFKQRKRTRVGGGDDLLTLPPDYVTMPPLPSSSLKLGSMIQGLEQSRQEFLSKLEHDYGQENCKNMFLMASDGDPKTTAGHVAFGDKHDAGRRALIRKFQIKLLQVLQSSSRDRSTMIPFVWATGGNSVAASHGNLVNESYTAILQRQLGPALAPTGIQFLARNQGMSGAPSGPEIAICIDSIFGLSADVIVWDYALTEGKNYGLMEHFLRHIGIHPNRPVALTRLPGGGKSPQLEIVQNTTDAGLSPVKFNEDTLQRALDAVPDSFGKNDAELQEMAPFVRDFKCNKRIERGEPYCDGHKWNENVCPSRRYKTSWHPGWRWHAVVGNLMALGLMEIVEDALEELAVVQTLNPSKRLKELVAEEIRDHQKFQQSALGASASELLLPEEAAQDDALRIPFESRGICRTARLPAYARFMGVQTESYVRSDSEYDIGISEEQSRGDSFLPNEGADVRLFYNVKDRQKCGDVVNLDHRDFYLLTPVEEWKRVVVPNEAEWKMFGEGLTLRGLIAIFLLDFDFGVKVDEHEIREPEFMEQVELKVNGVEVVSVVIAGENGRTPLILRHADGLFFQPNDDGRFEIQMRVKNEGRRLSISSFVVW